MQKLKSNTFQKYQLSYFLKNVKIEVLHEQNTQFSFWSSKYSVIEDSYTQITSFLKIHENAKREV